MSSLTNRSATGAVKTKVQNVNSVYSGKNQLQGGKPVGRNGGLTAIGKASGVVRRMPPPPTLPSLRAESQGQDPDIAIVPQGGTGWSKSEAPASATAPAVSLSPPSESKPTHSSPSAPPATSPGVDMRPAWAKPASPATPSNETTPVAGYPTLASSAAASNEETRASRTWRSSGSMSEEPMQELPARFYDGGNVPARPYQPSRFQGSSDARATQPGATYGATPVARQSGQERWSTSESREPIAEEPAKKSVTVVEPRAEKSYDYTKSNGTADEQQVAPAPQLKLLKRPATAAAAVQQQPTQQQQRSPTTVADLNRALIEDEDEELCMTKLTKPATRVMKRTGPGTGGVSGPDGTTTATVQSEVPVQHKTVQQQPKEEKKQQQKAAAVVVAAPPKQAATPERTMEEDMNKDSSSPPPTAQPAENIWEKRKEERASAERERASQLRQRGLEATMQQHFPSVAEAATMRVDKESTRKPADAEFARVAMRARRGPVVNDVRALQEAEGGGAAAPPPRPRQQPQLQQRRRQDEGEYGYERRREYDDRRQYERGGYERRDNYRQDYGRQQDYGRSEREECATREEGEERPEGGEEQEDRGTVARREYPSTRGSRGGAPRAPRGNGYAPRAPRESGQRGYERGRDDQDESETVTQSEEGGQQQQQQRGSDKRSWRRGSQDEGEEKEERRKEEDDVDNSQHRRRYNNNSSQQQQPRVTMTRGVRGGRSAGARGSARGGGAVCGSAPHQQRRTQPRGEEAEGGDAAAAADKRQAPSRPTRGLYAPKAARRGGYEGRNTRPDANGVETAAVMEERNGKMRGETTSARLKSPVVSSEGQEEWETASESSRKGAERKSATPAGNSGVVPSRSNGSIGHSQQTSKNGQPPASRSAPLHTTTHAKREGGTRKGERPERQAFRKESATKRVLREDSEESVDRLAGLDLHDERRVVIVDDHPATTTLAAGADHADFEEVLSKKQKRARAEEEKARAEAEERRAQRERERAERVAAKKEKRLQAKSEREEAQRARQAEAAAKKKADKEDKMTTVWNSAQPEARAALESSEAAAAAAASATAVSVDAAGAAAAAADGQVLPSPIARPHRGPAKKAPAVQLPPTASNRTVQDKYEFMYDEEAAKEAAAIISAQKTETTEDSDERVTLAPSETGSAVTTDDQRRLTENVSMCKELWNSGDVALSTASTAGVAPVAPLIVHHSATSAHHSPASVAAVSAGGTLPANVAKVKPQPHSSSSASAPDAGDASGVSCTPRPPSANSAKQAIMAGMSCGMHGVSMQSSGHPPSIMGARSPVGMNSAFNPGFGGFNNVFGGAAADMGGLSNGSGGFKGGMPGVSPPNIHGAPYGSRLHGGMQQQQQRGFEHGGGLFPHPVNRATSAITAGWSPPFEPMVPPPTSTTPPHPAHAHAQMSRTNNVFGLFGAGAQPPQLLQQPPHRPPHAHLGGSGPFSAPPPSMPPPQNQHHGHSGPKNNMMPPIFPTSEMMNMPPPSLSLGAVGDRAARQLQQSQQMHQQQHIGGFGGEQRSGGNHGFSMPPPMGGSGAGLFSRPPPSSTEMWKGGPSPPSLPPMQQQQPSGRSFSGAGGQYGASSGRMMQHKSQGMHGAHHQPPPPHQQQQQQHMQHSQQKQQAFGGGGEMREMWMQQGGGGQYGGGQMGRMNMGGRGDSSAMWRS